VLSPRRASVTLNLVRTLLVLRHAKAVPDAGDDEARELAPRGRKDAVRMGERALALGLVPDRVLCSSAVRTRETAALFLRAAGFDGVVEFLPSLYLAEPKAYLSALAAHAASAARPLVIGHNPGLESLVRVLTGERVALGTSALVECSLPIESFDSVAAVDGQGRLVRLASPGDA
jgi:phosphohistidine phosphatase